jgi:hypothetical protein
MTNSALAWFSRQIPTEGFSDINQGRIAEGEIPHSDQWIDGIGKSDGSYKPDEFNIKNVLKDRNGRGISKIIVEEIYQSREYRMEAGVGLHNAAYLDGRFIYESPANWINANTVNRTIALRRCDTTPREYNFGIRFLLNALGPYYAFVSITSDFTTEDAMTYICKRMHRAAGRPNFIELTGSYIDGAAMIEAQWPNTITIQAADPQFWGLLNVEPARRPAYLNNAQTVFNFPNVWNRHDLFIHASFVNNTAGGFLSRGDEFYTSPSKQYKVEYPISTFYFETTTDGFHKIALPYENFIVELSFLIDVEDYY